MPYTAFFNTVLGGL